ncbi:unnamed protein product, partial [Oppiella nova]
MGLGKTIEVLSCILANPRPVISGLNDNFSEYNKLDLIDWSSSGHSWEWFACVCGLISNVRKYRKKKLVLFDQIAENDDNDSDDTEVDDEYTEQMDEKLIDYSKIVDTRGRKRREKRFNEKVLVRCRGCGSYQHAVCVNYNTATLRPYFCGHCWARDTMKRLDSRATLIVSPRSISHQWQDEITKHVDC